MIHLEIRVKYKTVRERQEYNFSSTLGLIFTFALVVFASLSKQHSNLTLVLSWLSGICH